MKIAVCIVTSRPEFLSWLRWNLQKQTRQPNVVSIIHSGEPEFNTPWGIYGIARKFQGVRENLTLGDLRNQALSQLVEFGGLEGDDIVTWFDDDDWYSAGWLDYLGRRVFAPGWAKVAYASSRHRFYLKSMQLADIEECAGTPALPATSCRYGLAKRHRFGTLDRGEEQPWIDGILRDAAQMGAHQYVITDLEHFSDDKLYRTVIHDRNTWDYHQDEILRGYESYGLTYPIPTTAPRGIWQPEWEDTLRRLSALRKELSCTSPSV